MSAQRHAGVAAHLGIRLRDYDREIRRFIPNYDEFLDAVAEYLPTRAGSQVVECGIGTGALAERILSHVPAVRWVGVDRDAGVLEMARNRLSRFAHCRFLDGDIGVIGLPRCDAVAATLVLHHIPPGRRKLALYHRLRASLRAGGTIVSGDCHPACDGWLAAKQMAAWRAHVRRSFSTARTRALFDQWAHEDHYTCLDDEIRLLRRAGLKPEVVWRRDCFAVIRAAR